MKVLADGLKISTLPFDEEGNKLEPEERPAERVMVTEGVKLAGQSDQQIYGSIPTTIRVQRPVHVFANGLRTMCGICKHFDQAGWLGLMKRWEGTPDGQATLHELREKLIAYGEGGEALLTEAGKADLNRHMQVLGLCRALTEHLKDEIIMDPAAGCPDESLPFFQERNAQAEKVGSAAYDALMKRADT